MPLEASFRTAKGNLVVKCSGETVKDLFEAVAAVQLAFDADTHCGLCGGDNLAYRVRVTSDASKWYELQCRACRGVLSFGQFRAGGGLFPKRDNGADGWKKYQPLPAGQPAERKRA